MYTDFKIINVSITNVAIRVTAHESNLTCMSLCSANSLRQNLPQTREQFSLAAIVMFSDFKRAFLLTASHVQMLTKNLLAHERKLLSIVKGVSLYLANCSLVKTKG